MANWLQRLFGKKEHPAKKHHAHIGCDFGWKEFNKSKRTDAFKEELRLKGKGRGPKNDDPVPPPPPPPPPSDPNNPPATILLDFNGHIVVGTSWNYPTNEPLVLAESGLSQEEQEQVLAAVKEFFLPFNVVVTVDEEIFQATADHRRIRCIFTETHEWYGNTAGGVAFKDSMDWLGDTPCFVFTSLWGYINKYIREAACHEIGHTIGLSHQAHWDENCVKLSDYYRGANGIAPIMGSPGQNEARWWIGPNSYGCQSIQDDASILATKLK